MFFCILCYLSGFLFNNDPVIFNFIMNLWIICLLGTSWFEACYSFLQHFLGDLNRNTWSNVYIILATDQIIAKCNNRKWQLTDMGTRKNVQLCAFHWLLKLLNDGQCLPISPFVGSMHHGQSREKSRCIHQTFNFVPTAYCNYSFQLLSFKSNNIQGHHLTNIKLRLLRNNILVYRFTQSTIPRNNSVNLLTEKYHSLQMSENLVLFTAVLTKKKNISLNRKVTLHKVISSKI